LLAFVVHHGPLGVFLSMVGESLGVPFLPSEIILPFGGFLVAQGRIGFLPLLALTVLAQVLGSLIGYGIGLVGGRAVFRALGRLTGRDELGHIEAWFSRYGPATVFWGRFLPVVRTYVSWPAGLSKMKMVPFIVLTVLGSIPWSAGLLYAGLRLDASWRAAGNPVQTAGWVVAILIVLLLLYILARRLGRRAWEGH